MKRFALLLSVAAVAVLLIAVAPRLAPAAGLMRDLSDPELAKIEKGEVILESQTNSSGNATGKGLAIGYINAPKEKVIDTILKYEDYPQFMPRVKSTEIYTRTDSEIDVHFTIEVAFIKVSYYLAHKVDRAAGTISWALDKSKKNDIAATDGFWGFKPYKNGTIVYYTVSVDTGRAVPKAVQDYLTNRDLPNIVKNMKKRVEGV